MKASSTPLRLQDLWNPELIPPGNLHWSDHLLSRPYLPCSLGAFSRVPRRFNPEEVVEIVDGESRCTAKIQEVWVGRSYEVLLVGGIMRGRTFECDAANIRVRRDWRPELGEAWNPPLPGVVEREFVRESWQTKPIKVKSAEEAATQYQLNMCSSKLKLA
ncbi:hypothetical protein Dimus_014932 [Dionaea muscipula]